MNKFNLEFKGEILPGHDPERAMRRFGELMGIEASSRLAECFSGETVVLKSNLERKTAAEYFSSLHKIGLAAQLVKMTPQQVAAELEAERIAQQKIEREDAELKAALEQRRKATRAARASARRKKAQQQAAEEKRRAAEEAARQKVLRDEAERKAAEEATRQEALRKEAERKAAEETARQEALRKEAERKAAEEAARQEALRKEAERKAAEEAARLEALRKEAERKAAEEAARQEALRKEAERKAAEEAARQEALRKEAERKAAEEAARLEALRKEAERKAAEEKRKKAARQKALREETERKAAEALREKAAEDARRKAAARRAAEALRKKAAEEAALQQARQRQQEAEQRALAEREREAEQRRILAEQAEQRKAMEDAPIQRAADELGRQPSLKPVNARVKTRLETPRAQSQSQVDPKKSATPESTPAGAANMYSLRPFRNTPEVQGRATLSAMRARKSLTLAGLALAGLLIAWAVYLKPPQAQAINGPGAMAIMPGAGPLLLAGERLIFHDRAGVATASVTLHSLGLAQIGGPMAFDNEAQLLVMGQLQSAAAADAAKSLLRCDLEQLQCRPLPKPAGDITISTFAVQPLTGAVLLADVKAGKLHKRSPDGDFLPGIDIEFAPQPVMRLESGLLFMNSPHGAAISVLRYDDEALGQQLDEILLLPPPAIAAGHSTIRDFVRVANYWWVTLADPDTGEASLYRFDEKWQYIEQPPLSPGTNPRQLANWGDRALVLDADRVSIQRFNAQGLPEAPLVSAVLEKLVSGQRRSRGLQELAWQSGLAALCLGGLAALAFACLHHLRSMVYRSRRERGAPPLDEQADAVQWIAPVADRNVRLRRTLRVYSAISTVLLVAAVFQGVSVLQLSALLAVLGGPLVALLFIRKSETGHIGIVGEQLLLADHSGMYHQGRDAQVQYRGPFLLLDDVVVFTGSRLLPAFPPNEIKERVTALARRGIKVDRKTVLVKLLHSGHPIARGAAAMVIGLALAITLLALQY